MDEHEFDKEMGKKWTPQLLHLSAVVCDWKFGR